MQKARKYVKPDTKDELGATVKYFSGKVVEFTGISTV